MGPNHLKMGGQWNVGTGLARVSEEGELTEPSVEETDCLTCDEASLCEPACSRGSDAPGALGVRSPISAPDRESIHVVEPAVRVDLSPAAPRFRDAPVAESTGVVAPTVNARDKPESLGFRQVRSKTFKFRSSSVDTGLNMLENRATHVASGYAMLMPLTLRVMEKLR